MRISSIILPLLLLLISACASDNPKVPEWNGKLYAGDSKSQAMERAQSHESIPASSAEFDDMIGMTYEDFKSFYNTYVMGCKVWKDGTPMISLWVMYERHKEQIEKAKRK